MAPEQTPVSHPVPEAREVRPPSAAAATPQPPARREPRVGLPSAPASSPRPGPAGLHATMRRGRPRRPHLHTAAARPMGCAGALERRVAICVRACVRV